MLFNDEGVQSVLTRVQIRALMGGLLVGPPDDGRRMAVPRAAVRPIVVICSSLASKSQMQKRKCYFFYGNIFLCLFKIISGKFA